MKLCWLGISKKETFNTFGTVLINSYLLTKNWRGRDDAQQRRVLAWRCLLGGFLLVPRSLVSLGRGMRRLLLGPRRRKRSAQGMAPAWCPILCVSWNLYAIGRMDYIHPGYPGFYCPLNGVWNTINTARGRWFVAWKVLV